jgi:predicted pyridoxine 5'-phosphate oxidase superfamily flavin-nucleotide-binding protein
LSDNNIPSRGFLRVLDDKTLAFADFSENRRYISMGNLSENDRAFNFLMDSPNRRRGPLPAPDYGRPACSITTVVSMALTVAS